VDALTTLIARVAATGAEANAEGTDIPSLVTRLGALREAPAVSEAPPVPNNGATAPDGGAGREAAVSETFPLAEYEQISLQDAQAAGLTVFHLTVTLAADCLMKSVRVFMALSALEPLGSVLVAHPHEDKLEAEEFDQTFQLLFATERPQEEIAQALGGISEMDSVTVTPWACPENVALAAPPPAVEEDATAPVAPTAHAQTIRVDVTRLDALLNLIGEMVIDRTQIAEIGADLHARYPHDARVGALQEATHRIARITSELQDEIMKTRMLPVDGVFQRMPRLVRDLAQKTGKEIDFQITGGETELDRTVLEALGDPLIHLLRNSMDHGIETPDERLAAGKPSHGTVTLSARHEENSVVIDIADDGRGIDPVRIKAAAVAKCLLTPAAAEALGERDTLNLIFASGFSTAQALSDISGRGVGMDIVKSNLEKLGGRIAIDSRPGRGTKFTLSLPLTLAIVRALLVSAGGGTYVLPLGSVVEILRLGKREGEVSRRTIGGQAAVVMRGRTIPLASLANVLCGDPRACRAEQIAEDSYVVVIGWAEKQIGLCVDGLLGEQEVVIKSLGTLLGEMGGLSGATILGDGRVGLIVDCAKAVEGLADEPHGACE
nr:chemotaxis protein CheA [Armatimonadota bacterium]